MTPINTSRETIEYLAAAGVMGIHVLRMPNGGHTFRVAIDIGKVELRGAEIVTAFWAESRSVATRVVRGAAAISNGTIDVAHAIDSLFIAAQAQGVHLSANDAVLARAQQSAEALRDRLHAAMSGGQLKAFNREYRNRRHSAKARGETFMNFATAKARFRRVLIGRLIAGAMLNEAIFNEVFNARSN